MTTYTSTYALPSPGLADAPNAPAQFAALTAATETALNTVRDTTNVNHYTYHLSRLAAAAGLVVIDDPDAILRCTNKIYLAELLTRHHIPIPKTLVVHPDNIDRIAPIYSLLSAGYWRDQRGAKGDYCEPVSDGHETSPSV